MCCKSVKKLKISSSILHKQNQNRFLKHAFESVLAVSNLKYLSTFTLRNEVLLSNFNSYPYNSHLYRY